MTNKAGLEFENEKLLPCDSEPDGMIAYSLAMQNPNRDDPNWPLPSFKATDWAEAFCKQFPNVPVDNAIAWFANALMRGYDERACAIPQPIDVWLPIETYDYEKFPQVILAGFITPSEYAQSNGSKPFWEISIGRCWHVNTRKFTGFLGQQPTHWMPLPKPPEGR